MLDIRVCVACTNLLGEGPLWDGTEGRLYWIDGLGKEIWRCVPDGSAVEKWSLPTVIGSMALRQGGGALLALENGLHLFDFATGGLEFIVDPEASQSNVRLNDGKIDSRGRFIVGSLDMDLYELATPGPARGRLYRVDPDFSVHTLETGIGVSNGPCWSPDQSTFYFTDTTRDTIFAYDWNEATGTPTARRCFAAPGTGVAPDGGTVDAEGFVWTATNGALSGVGELRRYAPDGSLDRTVTMPVVKLTSLMFGGPDLDILFVTSMNLPSVVAPRPDDGCLFAVHGLGIRGLPERRFAG